jgi:putative membrane protein
MVQILLRWLLYAVALMIVGALFRGVWVKSFGSALLAAFVIGLINALLGTLLQILAFPLTVITLGLFYFVVNGFLFWLAGRLLSGFRVEGGCAAIGGAAVYTLLGVGIRHLVG